MISNAGELLCIYSVMTYALEREVSSFGAISLHGTLVKSIKDTSHMLTVKSQKD